MKKYIALAVVTIGLGTAVYGFQNKTEETCKCKQTEICSCFNTCKCSFCTK